MSFPCSDRKVTKKQGEWAGGLKSVAGSRVQVPVWGEDNHGQVQHFSELEGFVLLGRGLILHAESRVRTYCPSNVSKIPSPLLSMEACAGSADLGVP